MALAGNVVSVCGEGVGARGRLVGVGPGPALGIASLPAVGPVPGVPPDVGVDGWTVGLDATSGPEQLVSERTRSTCTQVAALRLTLEFRPRRSLR